MGRYIEIVLIILIVIFIAISGTITVSSAKQKSSSNTKSIELENAHLREVNQTSLIDDINSKRVWQQNGIWYFREFHMQNAQMKYLKAKEAMRDKDYIELVDSVKMLSSKGVMYNTEHFVYLKDKNIFYTRGKFSIKDGSNLITGINLYHNIESNITKAENVYGRYFTLK